jgi:tRNA A37 N6-isopentenylltransferase MiaA
MADNNGGTGLDLLTKAMNDIAREIGEMDPNDPLRSERITELHALTKLSKSTKAERNKFIYEKMDVLAREVDALKPRDPRRADIVNEIIRLSHLILK